MSISQWQSPGTVVSPVKQPQLVRFAYKKWSRDYLKYSKYCQGKESPNLQVCTGFRKAVTVWTELTIPVKQGLLNVMWRERREQHLKQPSVERNSEITLQLHNFQTKNYVHSAILENIRNAYFSLFWFDLCRRPCRYMNLDIRKGLSVMWKGDLVSCLSNRSGWLHTFEEKNK